MIANKQKVINSIGKSKLDWKQFTKKEKMDKHFEKNRKSGFIDK